MSGGATRPRVLFILERFPWPLEHGAHLRHLNIIKRLQDRFLFDIYCRADRQEPPAKLTGYFDQIIAPQPPTISQEVELKASPEALSPSNDSLIFNKMQDDLKILLDSGQYEVAVTSNRMLRHLPRRSATPIVGDIIDNDCLAFWRSLRCARNLHEVYGGLRSLLAHAVYQRRYFRRLSCVCYASDVDALISRRISRYPNHEVIPNGVDTSFFCPADQSP